MDFRSLTLDDLVAWARLLAVSFDRTPEQMEALLRWFHRGFSLVTWGAWDGDRLVAQYNARLLQLNVPGMPEPALAAMGLDMAVDPEYRGRGLLDAVARPVHEMLTERGCLAGVGFSSAGGLAVTRASRSYAYTVLGPMSSTVVVLSRPRYPSGLLLTDEWPEGVVSLGRAHPGYVSYAVSPAGLRHRFAEHPFRRYAFGAWRDGETVRGIVIYRRVRLRGIPGAALLAAYGEDVPGLLGRWGGAMRRAGVPVVHVVTSPGSPLRRYLGALGIPVTVPVTRNPYHLIARGLQDDAPAVLFDLQRWDCVGGDIL